ncbi:phage tail protein [Salmonella enterica]|nr:phage tail protein [Salmonella enterica]
MSASPKFKTVITDYGKQRLIAAMSPGGTKLTLTQMAVGDGGGNPTTPDATSTALVNEVWRAAVNSVTVDKNHPNTIIADLLIPAKEGGFWIREAGIYDELNKLVAICNLPASEKPLLEEGSGRDQTVRMTLVVSDTSIVNITVDSTTIIATNDYVDNSLKEHEKSRNHPDATLTDKGFTKLYSGVMSDSETLAATPKAVKIAMDNANARLAKERNLADLTNIPLARQSLQLGNSATRNVGTTSGTVAAGDDARITGAVQKAGDTMTGKLTLPQTSGFGVNTDNVLGGSSITFGDNDTGIKQNGDGILDFYANGQLVARIQPGTLYALNAVQTGDGKKLTVSSRNNSTLNAGVSLWGDGNRPTVIELGDDQSWHLYSQRNPDGSIVFVVNGDINANTLRAGGAIYQNNGDSYGSVWGNNWLSIWLNNQFAARDNNINARVTSDYVNQTFVRAVRLGPQAFSGALWRDYQLGGGNVVTGFRTNGGWEMEGNDDHVYYRPVQYLVNGTWVTAASV